MKPFFSLVYSLCCVAKWRTLATSAMKVRFTQGMMIRMLAEKVRNFLLLGSEMIGIQRSKGVDSIARRLERLLI